MKPSGRSDAHNYFDISPFKQLILWKSGISLDESRDRELAGIIREMMDKNGIDTQVEYYNRIVGNQPEFFHLLNRITVNETYFFREPGQIRLFSRKLVRERLECLKPGEKIRTLSAGCSTGEESYSLAMAVSSEFGKENQHLFSFTGVDIDADAIQCAEQGIYSGRSFRSFQTPDQFFPDEYFEPVDAKKYRIKPCIRELVRFDTANLLHFPYPEFLTNMDFVFYRNVSIYFTEAIRKQIFHNLSQIVKENGYLIVSSTETLSHRYDILKLIEVDGHFIFKKEGGRKRSPSVPDTFEESFFSSRKSVPAEPFREPIETVYEKALKLAKEKKYENALEEIEKLSKSTAVHIKGQILKAGIFVNLKRFDDAKEICRTLIEKDPLCRESYLLSGIIAKERQRWKEAIKNFRSALYIDPSSWLAHFHLAEIHQTLFDNEPAIREYRAAMKYLTEGGYDAHGLTLFSASFSVDDMLHLCRMRITRIDEIGKLRP